MISEIARIEITWKNKTLGKKLQHVFEKHWWVSFYCYVQYTVYEGLEFSNQRARPLSSKGPRGICPCGKWLWTLQTA